MTALYDYVIKINRAIQESDSNNKRCREYMDFFRATSNYNMYNKELSEEPGLKRKLACLTIKQQSLLDLQKVIPKMRSADAPEVFTKIAADLRAISAIVEQELPETAAAIVVVRDLLSAQNRGPSVTKE